jgi:hypothetical protein
VLQLKMTRLPNGGKNPEQWLAGSWKRLAVSVILIRRPGKISFSYFKGLRIIFCIMFLLPAESCGKPTYINEWEVQGTITNRSVKLN